MTGFRSVVIAGALGVVLLSGPSLAAAEDVKGDVGAPAGILIEAESGRASDSKVVADSEGSAGQAVANGRAWQPLCAVEVPKEGAELTVWVRHKGGPIQLKSTDGGKQTDRQWVWAKPEKWSWSSLGRYLRKDLGESVLLMRGEGEGDVVVDCVVFASDAFAAPGGAAGGGGTTGVEVAKELPPERPDPAKPAGVAKIDVKWAEVAFKVPAEIWGINDYESVHKGVRAADKGLAAYLTALQPALVRLHEGGLTDEWTNGANRDWDVVKIRAALGESEGLAGASLMVNVPRWPGWMKAQADGTLAAEDEEELVQLIARLATFLKDSGRNVTRLEVLNEMDGTYEKAGKLDALWRLHRRMIVAAKRANPALKVGGPAFTWPKPLWVDGFLAECGDVTDFVSWHSYAVGDINETNERVFAQREQIQSQNDATAKAVKAAAKDRPVEVFLTEYNVKWTWDPFERRHANSVGAVFQAGLLKRAASVGLNGVLVWHLKGHAYGLIDADDKVRTTGQLYLLGRKYLVGETVVATSDNADVEPWAVRMADGRRAVLLTNKSDHTADVTLPVLGATVEAAFRLDADGMAPLTPAEAVHDGRVEVPGFGLVLLVLPK